MTRMGLAEGFTRRIRLMLLVGVAFGLAVTLFAAPMARADGVPLNPGDVLADVGNGQIRHFTNTGTLVDTLNTNSGTYEGDGMCFDGSTNLFATQGFGANTVSEFNKGGNLVTTNFGSGYNSDPESCVVNQAGDVFVGQPDGTHHVLEFDPAGNKIGEFAPAIQDRGTDWIDLASDQCTLRYTSEGDSVKQFNVCTNTQLPDFATGLPGGACYGHRILSDGGELVACTSEIVRLDSSGNVVQTYTPDPNGFLFAINLDPDGSTFWTADYLSGTIYRINISSGAVVTTFTTPPNTVLGGLAIVGEITAAQDSKITASGTSVSATEGSSFSGTVATFSDADSAAKSSDYTASINWGDGTTTTGTISGSPSQFTVSGSHTYSEEGSQTITVTITDTDTSSNTATATSKASIADAALHATGVKPSLSGKKASGRVATFTDSDSGGTLSDYTATINWGDGHTSTGTVGKSGSSFTVSGTHKYHHGGKHTITVTIRDKGGSTATATTTLASHVKAAKVSAKLSNVPTACVSSAFTASVQGTRIASVRFMLDGRQVPTTRLRRHRQYTAQISASPGHHTLTVKIKFLKGSAARSRTFNRTVVGCARPSFTG